MNTVEELEDILSLCRDDERFAIRQALSLIKKIRAQDDKPVLDLEFMDEVYNDYIAHEIPRREWPENILNYEGYIINGNIQGSGACLPQTSRPLALGERETWGLADTYPVAGTET